MSGYLPDGLTTAESYDIFGDPYEEREDEEMDLDEETMPPPALPQPTGPVTVTIHATPESLAVIEAIRILGRAYLDARVNRVEHDYEKYWSDQADLEPLVRRRGVDTLLLHAQRYVVAANYITLGLALEDARITEGGNA